MFVAGPPVPMLPALPAYDGPGCRGGGEMYRSPPIGYGSLNRALSGRRVSARGGYFVPSPDVGIEGNGRCRSGGRSNWRCTSYRDS